MVYHSQPPFHHSHMDNIQICLDISFVDHPYLIGPRGRKCQHLMDRHKSRIHFPDCNRRLTGPKLNNVLITGSIKNAEEVRLQLRYRTPIRLAVQLQQFPDVPDLVRRMEDAITQRSLPIRLNCSEDYCSGILKTEWRNEDILVKFCDEFLGLQRFNNSEIFTIAETVLPLINPWNADVSEWLIEHAYDLTGCRIFYPPREKFADQPPSYFVKGGSASGVLRAARFVTGLTMFLISFTLPHHIQVDRETLREWQDDLLVHVSIEPFYNANNQFLHEKATLRSFEFCLNNVYIVRSMLLGFKKTVQSSAYDFMSSAKQLIPGNIFFDAQLYFPLYAIDDERSFDWSLSGEAFYNNFYGGPQSLRGYDSCNMELTGRLQSLMKVDGVVNNNRTRNNGMGKGIGFSHSMTRSKNSASFVSGGASLSPVEVARGGSPLHSSQQPQESKFEQRRDFRTQQPPATRLYKRLPIVSAPEELFSSSSPNVFGGAASPTLANSPFGYSPLSLIPSISASPSALEHSDNPEMQVILRRTMPCLEVTKEQINAVDGDAVLRAVMTGDRLATMSDPSHRPFNFTEYAVSYPALVSVEEYNKQFGEFLRERDQHLQIQSLASEADQLALGMDVEQTNGKKRKSANF